MAEKFINGKSVQVFLGEIIKAMPYLAASKKHFADQIVGKKNGKDGANYSVVLRDAGRVSDELEINDESDGEVQEREVTMTMMKKKTFVDVDTLSSIVDIKDFKSEIAETYGTHLGAECQKTAIENTFFKADTATVAETNGWTALAPATAKMKAARVGGKIVGFMDPLAEANLSINALNGWHFGPSEQGAKFYHDASIGKFMGAEFVYVNDVPNVTGVTVTGTISAIEDNGAYSTITLGSAINVKKGTPLKVAGAKACNVVGMPISSDFVLIVQEDVNGTEVKVQKVITDNIGSRNCAIEGDTLVGAEISNLLANGKEYYVAQVRAEDTLSVDNVPLDDLAGAENKTDTVGGLDLHVTKFGDSKKRMNRTRWDIAMLYGMCDSRLVSLAYMPV